ncbi:MAG: FAD-dependent oxidoreductase [Streptococcaceae bacterium]|jgi:NADPH-dependent 2,4-dienoyl-CoA reductase/sulfur reductase-like enzyme|nr:FAD-dependent oxidoreductase [Streptococcaceae bacterium]
MKISIIGGSHAGIACALRAREEFPEASIVIYEKQKIIGFIAQSIPFYLSGNSDFLKLSSYVTVSDLVKQNITVKTQVSVNDIDLDGKTIEYTDLLDNIGYEDSYDKLILAVGSYPSLPILEDGFQEELYIVKKAEDADKLKKLMQRCRSIIVIGGGGIGVEIAKILADAKIETTLVHSADYILNRYLDKEAAQETEKFLESRGIKIYTNSVVKNIKEETVDKVSGKKISHVFLHDDRELITDGVIYTTGFRPNSFLVADQLEIGDRGAILVDEYMHTSHPDVFAVGDCATTVLTNIKAPSYVPHASDAIRQGEIAAVNLVENKVKLNKSQGTFKMNFDKDLTVCMTGMSMARAILEGFDCAQISIENEYIDSDKYYKIWMVYEKVSHRILGLQCVGTASGIAATSDLISLAIQEGLSVEDIEYTDFYFKHGFKKPKGFTKLLADEIRHDEKLKKDN